MDIAMTALEIIVTSIVSLVILFLLAKLIGNKQLSELNLFDYVNGITIGSIAAECASAGFQDFLRPLLAMVIYGAATTGISIIAAKSRRARAILAGRAIVLMDKGKLHRKSLKKARLDLDEFLSTLRVNGYFDLSQIETVVFESNGRLSVLLKSANRPLTPQDSNTPVAKESFLYSVIMDGRIMETNLHRIGKDSAWLIKELKKQKINKVTDIFLALGDENNNLQVYKNE